VPAAKATGAAVIVCPGGGYVNLSMDKEGDQVARWLNSIGVASFVLKYRLGPKYRHPIELGDAQRAIRTVRAKAVEYRVMPDRIGIMGFSAGGHLASSAGTHFEPVNANASDPIDGVSSRPDFLVLVYPVISFTTPYVHRGSLRALLGDNPDPKLVELLSSELQVTAQTPPTFLFHTTTDTAVPSENSALFYLALRKAGVPAEMHIYEQGPHGVGLAPTDAALSTWPARLADWLRVRGLLNAAAK
jgi:acetyl esterase/lipase